MNPILFGVFLPPSAAGIDRLRAQVQTAESTGFDYVSIQDHPYASAFLDTFATIGYLLGQTERLRFMPNVADLRYDRRRCSPRPARHSISSPVAVSSWDWARGARGSR